MNFSDWLLEQLHERDWTQADLARASGLTRATISYYLGQKSKKPDENALRQIAKAFKISPESIFRAAGLLPSTPTDPIVDEITYLASQLPTQDVQELIELARLKLARHERTENVARKA